MNSIFSSDLWSSLPSPLQRRSSLRPLLFSTGKSAYCSSSEPFRIKRPIPFGVPIILSLLPLRRLLFKIWASRACNAPRPFTAMKLLSRTAYFVFLQRFVRLSSSSPYGSDARPITVSRFSRLHRASHASGFPYMRMPESQRRRLRTLPLHSACQITSSLPITQGTCFSHVNASTPSPLSLSRIHSPSSSQLHPSTSERRPRSEQAFSSGSSEAGWKR